MKIYKYGLIPLLALTTFVSCTKPTSQEPMTTTTVEMTVSKDPNYQIPENFELVPGKSFGDVNLGEETSSLLRKGFVADKEYAEGLYLIRGGLHVSLFAKKADLIWLERDLWGKVLFKGKALPSLRSIQDAKKVFSSCEKPIQGSGGRMVYCENRGLRIDTSFPKDDVTGFSVVLPSNYDSMVSAIEENEQEPK